MQSVVAASLAAAAAAAALFWVLCCITVVPCAGRVDAASPCTSTACRDTYEQQLFECASRKYGLDEAILGFSGTGSNQAEASSMATTAAWASGCSQQLSQVLGLLMVEPLYYMHVPLK